MMMPICGDLLVSLFQTSGAAVHSASTTAEALQLAATRPPEVLITDIAMPGQDGYVLLERLIELLGPDMPRVTVAVTAHASAEDQRRVLRAGFQRYVAKPFDPNGLVELVDDLIHEPGVDPKPTAA
jgi:CheY-like chemotaxis protein